MSEHASTVFYARFDARGQYVMTGTVPLGSSTLDEAGVHVGLVDPLRQYHGEHGPVDMPPCPSPAHRFDFGSKSWVFDAEAAAQRAKSQRAQLLTAADHRVNTIEDDGGDASAWRAYRKALRDLPAQAGFPETFAWPTPPTTE